MQRRNGQYWYSPTDLIEFLDSHFAAWMSRFYLDYPYEAYPDPDTLTLTTLKQQGTQHEQACLAGLQAEGPNIYVVPDNINAVHRTQTAMKKGHAVIYQGVLEHEGFRGRPDFLIRVDGQSTLGTYHYEVWDTKLARNAKPDFLIQLCCYADLLAAWQGKRPQHVWLVLGTGKRVPFRTDDYFYYYRALKAAFLELMHDFDPKDRPDPDLGGTYGQWTSFAEAYLRATDHLSQVANITTEQIRKLQRAGITTMTALATTSNIHISKLETTIFARLKEQAQLQCKAKDSGSPPYRILLPNSQEPRRGLALLPPASPHDVYFDIEGYPLATDNLEYLFGAVTVEDDISVFHDWWAHDVDEERQAFEAFVDWVYARWQNDPTLHIYHYAAYERSALRRLMGKYGSREEEVDVLLRNNVLVDLYTVVRQGVRVGEPGYSLKNLEHLYAEKREGAVTTAEDSLVYYDQWLASGEPRRWEESPLLKDIRDYNAGDCTSLWQLAKWLRARQQEAGISWLPKLPPGDIKTPKPDIPKDRSLSRQELAQRLLNGVSWQTEASSLNTGHWPVQALLGHVVEFHHREDKPVWWAMFDRSEQTPEELTDDLACLGGLTMLPEPPEPIKSSLGFWYAFDPEQDTRIEAGSSCYFAHNTTVSSTVHELDRSQGRVCLKLGQKKLKQLPGQQMPEQLSLIPNEHVPATVIANSIYDLATHWLETQELPPALDDFLQRRPPRCNTHAGGSLVQSGEDVVQAAIRIVAGLERSTLCIQGPPGSGKSTTGAHIILSLLGQGKRVGITSNSHAAILNLLDMCNVLSGGSLECLKVGGAADDPFFHTCPKAVYASNTREAVPQLPRFPLVGGSAWVFSDADVQDQFDYLFVDEASQVSVANLIGMAPAAQNLVLLGDQMQLGQPIQGTHPGGSGCSALEYLLQGRATIPDELGLFLPLTWRLHPKLCRVISSAVYDDRLDPAPGMEKRIIRVPKTGGRSIRQEAGIVFVPVHHDGNTQGSDEEVAVVKELIDELLGRPYTDETGRVAGHLQFEDILCVAPYNVQVRKLQRVLGSQARVGSIDKFQGQEARVVILSMCASRADVSPRGIEFLLHKNRLNVALSRAQSLAIVVANPALAQSSCTTLRQMELLNLFCRVMQEGGHVI